VTPILSLEPSSAKRRNERLTYARYGHLQTLTTSVAHAADWWKYIRISVLTKFPRYAVLIEIIVSR
jgi:hypothetical protein